MAVRTAARSSPWTTIRRGGCGDTLELALRSVVHYRSEGREPLCANCRRPPVTLTVQEREKFARWWRRQLPEEDLLALADAIWGPR